MSERRFVIREIYEGEDPKSIHWVVESELKRRLEVFSDEAYWRNEGVDNIIDILLHGEGKEVNTEPSGVTYRVDAMPDPKAAHYERRWRNEK